MLNTVRNIGIALLCTTALAATPALAQTQSAQSQPAAQSAQSFSQSQLQSFAEARAKIRQIRSSAMQKMQQAKNRKAAQQISKQAKRSMISAIKDTGLGLKTYNQIARAAKSNPKLASKIQNMQ